MTTATAAAAPTYQAIAVDSSGGGICTITLNRPDVLNAFNDQLTTELHDALKSAEREPGTRVIVITGAGRAFSSGQDLADLKTRYVPGYVPELDHDLHKRYNPIIRRIREMEKPVIASVNGVAAGAGCSLALACDMRLASDQASFIEVFINVGLIPDSGSTFMLPRLVGLGRAMELCCTGRKVDAAEALQIGLVNQVVPAEQLVEATTKFAAKLASLPSRAIALTKRLLNQSLENDLSRQLELESFAQETAGKTKDHTEGVVAFLEKRKPTFRGE
jgi:2-(1,2-epoxy-1,2-dihydrophenyl)acetyl-CoA isomerase